jgi:predicted Zn-dependent protease
MKINLLIKVLYSICLKKRILACLLILLQTLPTLTFALTPYSTDELDNLEKEFIQIINQSHQVERNPLANQYINYLGKKLAAISGTTIPAFFIVKSREINAFAGPGGYIGINSQLILTTETESELAAVLAHEIAHVRLHHLYNQIMHQQQMKIPTLALVLASIALGAINPTLGSGALMASMTGMAQQGINFTRSQEKEADRIGIYTLKEAGFDVQGMVNFFKKMQQHTRYFYTENVPAILRSHPLDDERIAEAQHRMSSSPRTDIKNSLEYDLFKEVIRVSTTQDIKARMDYYNHACKHKERIDICHYGQALSELSADRFANAKNLLSPLLQQQPDNLFYLLPMIEAESRLGEHDKALGFIATALQKYPGNYGILMAYGQALLEAKQPKKAINILLKASRLYRSDLALCHALARAQSEAHEKGYAYFTRAQCLTLQGQKRPAIAQLNIAKTYAKNNTYLLSRIQAKIEEIKETQQ